MAACGDKHSPLATMLPITKPRICRGARSYREDARLRHFCTLPATPIARQDSFEQRTFDGERYGTNLTTHRNHDYGRDAEDYGKA